MAKEPIPHTREELLLSAARHLSHPKTEEVGFEHLRRALLLPSAATLAQDTFLRNFLPSLCRLSRPALREALTLMREAKRELPLQTHLAAFLNADANRMGWNLNACHPQVCGEHFGAPALEVMEALANASPKNSLHTRHGALAQAFKELASAARDQAQPEWGGRSRLPPSLAPALFKLPFLHPDERGGSGVISALLAPEFELRAHPEAHAQAFWRAAFPGDARTPFDAVLAERLLDRKVIPRAGRLKGLLRSPFGTGIHATRPEMRALPTPTLYEALFLHTPEPGLHSRGLLDALAPRIAQELACAPMKGPLLSPAALSLRPDLAPQAHAAGIDIGVIDQQGRNFLHLCLLPSNDTPKAFPGSLSDPRSHMLLLEALTGLRPELFEAVDAFGRAPMEGLPPVCRERLAPQIAAHQKRLIEQSVDAASGPGVQSAPKRRI